MTTEPLDVLRQASRVAGINAATAELIRAAENTLYRLPHGVVARVGRRGQAATASKEVLVSRWLSAAGIPVVEALPDVDQPAVVDGRAVTFWRELPAHERGSAADVAEMLKHLHKLPLPDAFDLPPLAPFVRIADRLAEAHGLLSEDRAWLLDRLGRLSQAYDTLPAGLPTCAVHGDAWGGNVVVTAAGPVLLDLERFAAGPPEWDLVSIAVDHFTFGSVTAAEWQDVCDRYGYDVTTWDGFDILRDARELRKVTFAVQMAEQHSNLRGQADYRIACVRGEHGPRPWHWRGVP